MQKNALKKIVRQALKEDIANGDITTHLLIHKNQISKAFIVTREKAVISGLDVVREVFKILHPAIRIYFHCKNGQRVKPHTKLLTLFGKTQALLTGERVALNFLSHLSGIATLTAQFVKNVPGHIKILDTRKTTPGLRFLERQAVRSGGGFNHRTNLNDMVLIKDNHKIACKNKMPLSQMVQLAKSRTRKPVEIEVGNLKEFNEALNTRADIILLDNMAPADIRKAVKSAGAIHPRPLLEISGRINLKNIRSYAQTGVDRISIGALTHSIKSIDMSLELL